jgi:hypothetical protein
MRRAGLTWPMRRSETDTAASTHRAADADLDAIVESGRGDVPLTRLRFRCSRCGTDRTDFVVTSRDNPQPW